MTILKLFNKRLEIDTEDPARVIYSKLKKDYSLRVTNSTFVILREKTKYVDCDYSYGLRFDSLSTEAKLMQVTQLHQEVENWMIEVPKEVYNWERRNDSS